MHCSGRPTGPSTKRADSRGWRRRPLSKQCICPAKGRASTRSCPVISRLKQHPGAGRPGRYSGRTTFSVPAILLQKPNPGSIPPRWFSLPGLCLLRQRGLPEQISWSCESKKGMAITKELPAKSNPPSHTGAFYLSFRKNLYLVTTIINRGRCRNRDRKIRSKTRSRFRFRPRR